MIINHINDPTEFPNMHCLMIGFEHLEIDGQLVVVSLTNKRPFNASNAEHFLCKAWIIAKYTMGHYRDTLHPLPWKPHCHPSPIFQHHNGWVDNDELVMKTMQTIVDEFDKQLVLLIGHPV